MHGGNITGFSTLASFIPKSNLGIIVLSNDYAGYFKESISFQLYDKLLKHYQTNWDAKFKSSQNKVKQSSQKEQEKSSKARQKNKKPSHSLDSFIGDYEHLAYPTMTIRQTKKGQLECKFLGEFCFLKHYHYNIFELAVTDHDWYPKLNFSTNTLGEIDCFHCQVEPTLEPAIFRKKV